MADSISDGFGWTDVKDLILGAGKLYVEQEIGKKQVANAANAASAYSQTAVPIDGNGAPVLGSVQQSSGFDSKSLLYLGGGMLLLGGAVAVMRLGKS
ncbi:hypothetical protein [Teredinibacter turnerae]|uniref:hypothetical protein n=1 Tax=Teredinibacter turnerae TaxID=2426 RepID=UPI000374FF70|nr:hypothetical protein [Teredinibacter turnerae]